MTAPSVWLFSLLRPRRLTIAPVASSRLHCVQDAREFIVEGRQTIDLDLDSARFLVNGPDASSCWFVLCPDGLLQRRFFGSLEVFAEPASLIVCLTAEVETAVNCIVGAELPIAQSGAQALAAQAVVSRSILTATRAPRHKYATFCDTTHCQFFRGPGPPGTSVWDVVRHTSGMILTQNGNPFAPLYSACCGGRTESGLNDGVPYTTVVCYACQSRKLPRSGHGLGLCQQGAMVMAAQGRSYAEILSHYYPAASTRFLS